MTQSSRRRLKPEQRREEILDAAVRLVLKSGLQRVTMEQIAKSAGASKALLYSYFDNLPTLLEAALKRETLKLEQRHRAALEGPHGFADMVRETHRINREEGQTRVELVNRLQADPEMKLKIERSKRKTQQEVVDFVTAEIQRTYALETGLAQTAARLAMGYPVVDGEAVDEIWAVMMSGAMQALEQTYGSKKKSNAKEKS